MKFFKIKFIGLILVLGIFFSGNALACASCVETGTTGVHAEKYDQLMNWYLLIGGIVSVLVYGWFFWLMYKFRAKDTIPDPEDMPELGIVPKHRGDPTWTWFVTVAIFAILMGLTAGTINMVEFYENPEEGWGAGPLTVKVSAHQYYWEFEYPDGNKSYDILTVPINTIVILEVTSEDVWHNFAVPSLRLKIDAIPNRTNVIWFDAPDVGDYPISCMELCGSKHTEMTGTLVLVEEFDYKNGLDEEFEQ
jgi:cytochrome c oxidase subunit 2